METDYSQTYIAELEKSLQPNGRANMLIGQR